MSGASPSITDVIAALSTEVVTRLADAGMTALTDGKILLGRQHVEEYSAASRIVAIPMGSTFGPRSVSGAASGTHPNAEQRAEIAQRAIASEILSFEIHCWGQANPPTEDGDWNVTRAIAHVVLQAAQALAAGVWSAGSGKWTDSTANATQLGRAGREFVFTLQIATPVLADLLPYAPAGVVPSAAVVEEFPAGHAIETVQIN